MCCAVIVRHGRHARKSRNVCACACALSLGRPASGRAARCWDSLYCERVRCRMCDRGAVCVCAAVCVAIVLKMRSQFHFFFASSLARVMFFYSCVYVLRCCLIPARPAPVFKTFHGLALFSITYSLQPHFAVLPRLPTFASIASHRDSRQTKALLRSEACAGVLCKNVYIHIQS